MGEKILPVTDARTADTEDLESTTLPEKKQNPHPLGLKWRRSILLGAFFCSVSLAVNIAAVILTGKSRLDPDLNERHTFYGAGRHAGYDGSSGDEYRSTLFQGGCEKAQKINTLAHIGINLLSTIILASSNYAMQCLSAPTRTELDRAHARTMWLDIGILSFRNLSRIGSVRVVFWLLLAISSIPLHLV
jgi:hypothetical protein